MASESGGDHGGLSGYVSHHLTHLANTEQGPLFDLNVVHYDTLIFALITGFIALFFFRRAAAKATPGVPGRFQTAVEMLVEMVEEQAKALVHGKLDYIAPLGLTIFGWVTVMNAIDLLPVDWLPSLAHAVGIEYLRPLPTADLNATLGMALGVFLLVLYYNLKIKGVGGYAHQLVSAPFGQMKLTWNPLSWIGVLALAFVNLFMNLVEYVSNTASHGIRLYGNMYAGELIFFLIAGLGGSLTVTGVVLHLITGSIWAIFHILIVLLQAFIFMMMALVYIGQAHEHH